MVPQELLDKHHLHLLMVHQTQTVILLAVRLQDVHRVNIVHLLVEMAKVAEMDMEPALLANTDLQGMIIL